VPADDDFGKKKNGGAKDAQATNLTPETKSSETPATEVEVEKPSHTTWKSTAGYVGVGLGVVGIGVGSVFGILSNGARSSYNGAKTDPSGLVTGITRAQALQYQSTAQSDALLANLLWCIGGGLLLVGVALKVMDLLGGS
jgi:hypothetical protein